MDYARIRTQVVKRPTGLTIYVRTPRTLRSGLGDDAGPVLPNFNPVTPAAPSSIDVTGDFSLPAPPTGVFLPSYIPTPSGPVIPGGSVIGSILSPLTIAPPGSTSQSTLETAARTLAQGASSLTSLIFPKIQPPQQGAVQEASAFGNVSNWLAQPSGIARLSNQVLIGSALGLGIVVSLLRRRR